MYINKDTLVLSNRTQDNDQGYYYPVSEDCFKKAINLPHWLAILEMFIQLGIKTHHDTVGVNGKN